jgi:putative membrane protein
MNGWQGMGWHAWGMGPHMWFGGPIFALLWIGLIALGAWLLIRYLRDGGSSGSHARDILDERYARGELSSEEYQERVSHLR